MYRPVCKRWLNFVLPLSVILPLPAVLLVRENYRRWFLVSILEFFNHYKFMTLFFHWIITWNWWPVFQILLQNGRGWSTKRVLGVLSENKLLFVLPYFIWFYLKTMRSQHTKYNWIAACLRDWVFHTNHITLAAPLPNHRNAVGIIMFDFGFFKAKEWIKHLGNGSLQQPNPQFFNIVQMAKVRKRLSQ